MGIADTYIKGRVLGKGTFGEVILATHKETGEVVAIKKIRVEDKKQVSSISSCLCLIPHACIRWVSGDDPWHLNQEKI